MTTMQHFEIVTATTLLDLEGTRQFAEAIGRAQELAGQTGTSRWAMVWSPTTCYACVAVVSATGCERTNFMGPMTQAEAADWFRATVTPEPGEFEVA